MSCSRSAWLGAWMDTASVACRRWPARRTMAWGTPTVLMVMWRAPMPTAEFRKRTAASTARRFSSGSPMPMNTGGSAAGAQAVGRSACSVTAQF